MPNTTLSDSDVEARVRDYARSLGLTDERAVAAALHHLETRTGRAFVPALEEACALLRSWWRHPSNRTAAA